MLFDKISSNLRILYLHGGIIVNTNNGITYNKRNYEFLTVILNMFIYRLFKMLCDQLGWNMFKIKVEITWRMLQTGISRACYVDVTIYSDGSVL